MKTLSFHDLPTNQWTPSVKFTAEIVQLIVGDGVVKYKFSDEIANYYKDKYILSITTIPHTIQVLFSHSEDYGVEAVVINLKAALRDGNQDIFFEGEALIPIVSMCGEGYGVTNNEFNTRLHAAYLKACAGLFPDRETN